LVALPLFLLEFRCTFLFLAQSFSVADSLTEGKLQLQLSTQIEYWRSSSALSVSRNLPRESLTKSPSDCVSPSISEERKASGRAATRIRPLIEEAMQKRRDRQRDQIPDESAIRGNFIPLSTVPLQRSPSPGHGKSPQNVLVGLSLTDSQLDKLSAM
jgi:hypothetical protein